MVNARQFMAARTAAWAKSETPLPYQRELLYIEGDGNQWILIDGSNKLSGDSRRYGTIKFAPLDFYPGGWWYFVVGSYNYGLSWGDGNKIVPISGTWTDPFAPEIGKVYEVRFECDKDKSPVLLFTAPSESAADPQISGVVRQRIYSLKIKGRDSGDLYFDIIPVLDHSGVACFYDKISGSFYYNRGTGEFTWGELET